MKHVMKFLLVGFSLLLFACSQPCDDVNCQNGGLCVDGTCICEAGFTGTNCEVETRAVFFGEWISTKECDSEPFPPLAIDITASELGGDQLIINFGGDRESIATVTSATTFTIPAVTEIDPFLGTNITSMGDGSIDSDGALTININIVNEGSSEVNCVYVGTK